MADNHKQGEGGRTEIQEVGEFGLIDILTGSMEQKQAGTVLGVGDDGAVLDPFGRQTVLSTDLLLEGVHFDLMYMPLAHLGYKAIVVNLSDIYAMMAQPSQVLFSLGVSNRFSVEAVQELYKGVHAACETYGVDLVGGDTSTSQKGLVLSVTAIGEVDPGQYVTRQGARPGDLIVVSGDLGGAYFGLQLLEREKRLFLENPSLQPDLEDRKYILGRILKPEARRDVVEWLNAESIMPRAMIDISDGLSSDLLHICKRSQVGACIYEDQIPIHADTAAMAERFGIPALTAALSGGEDYELLFTVSAEHQPKIAANKSLHIIGEVLASSQGVHLETRGGNRHDLQAQGWNAFPRKKE